MASQDLVKLTLAAALEGGTKAAFKTMSDGFKLLGKEAKATSNALLKAGKTEMADTFGHLGMTMDRVTQSFGSAAKTGKMLEESLKSGSKTAKNYAGDLEVVQKAYNKWSNAGKGSAANLAMSERRTNALSKSIEHMGSVLTQGGASAASIEKWKESLNFKKVWSGMRTGDLKETSNGFKDLGTEGLRLLGIQGKLATALEKAGGANRIYHEQLKKGREEGNRYTTAVRELGKVYDKNNISAGRWAPTLAKVHTEMDKVRAVIGKATNNTQHWTRTTKLASLTQSVLNGNLEVTNKGFKILNDQGLKKFTGLTYDAAKGMKILSKDFANLPVKEGASSLTAYGRAVKESTGTTKLYREELKALSKQYGVHTADFKANYADMKRSNALWNKHVTTLEKTGEISSKVASQMRKDFSAAGTSSDKLAKDLARPNKQYEELRKTINRVSVATGKTTESLWEQTRALKAQKVPHDKIVNSMNEKIGVNKEYNSLLKTLNIQEKKLAELTDTTAAKMQKATQRAMERATTDKELVKVAKNLTNQYEAKIKSINKESTALRRTDLARIRAVKGYDVEIRASKAVQKEYRNMIKAYHKNDIAGKKAEMQFVKTAKAQRIAAAASGLMSRALKDVGVHIKSFASYALAASFIAGIVGAFQQATVAIIEFDQALKDLQAITGATDREVEQMGETIKQVASTTKFSATEVAAGMKTLGQAGLSAKEAIQTIQAVSDLATGTLSDMGTSVDLVTTAMRVFDIAATDSSRIADVFANAINKSKLTVDKLRIAFNYVGPIAARAGVEFEEVASSMMVLANSGVRASTIGTGLRQVFAKLVKPTDAFKLAVEQAGYSMDDFDLKTKSMRSVIENLSVIVTDAGDAFKFFGLRGATAISALTQSSARGFDTMMAAVTKTGTAAKMASIQMEGLGVKIKNMWDKAKNLAIALGETGLAGVLHSVVNVIRSLTDVLIVIVGNPITGFIFKISAAIAVLLTFTVAVRALTSTKFALWLAASATGATGFSASMAVATGAVTKFWLALFPAAQVLIIIAAALTTTYLAFQQFKKGAIDSYKEAKNLSDVFSVLVSKMAGYKEKIVNMDKYSKEFYNSNLVLRGELSKVATRLDDVGEAAKIAMFSIDLLTGEFIDGGNAVELYFSKIKEMDKIDFQKAVNAAESAFQKSTSTMSLALNGIKDAGYSVVDMFKNFIKLSANTMIPFMQDTEKAKQALVGFGLSSKDAATEFINFNKTVTDFKSGEITYAEFKKAILSSKYAMTEMGQETIKALQIVENEATAAMEKLLKLGEIDFRMTNEEIINIAKSFGFVKDESDAVAKAMVHFAESIRKANEDSINGLASKWANEFGKFGNTYDSFLRNMQSKDTNIAENLLQLNADVIRGYEERKNAIVEAWNASQREFGVDHDWAKLIKAQADYNQAAKKLQAEGRKDNDIKRYMEIRTAEKQAKTRQKILDQQYEDHTIGSETYYRKSEENARKHMERMSEIMGNLLDPKKAMKDYAAFKESEETLLKDSLLEIERQRALDIISQEEYEKKRIELTHNTYRQIAWEADWLYNKLADQKADPAEMQKMFKLMSDANQKYKGVVVSTLQSIQTERDSNTKSMKTALEKQTKEYDKHTSKVVKLEGSAAEKIVKIKSDLNSKIADLLEDRRDVEKEAIADTADMHDDVADKIRGIYQRDMTDEQKEYDNAAWAQEKYALGVTALNKAIRTGDKEQLDRAKSLLDDSAGLYENLESTGKAVSGLRKIEDAMTKAIGAGKDIELSAIDADIKKELKKADTKINIIQRVLSAALSAENKRHTNVVSNLNAEIALLKQKGVIIQNNLDIALGGAKSVATVVEPDQTTDSYYDFSPKSGTGEAPGKIQWGEAKDGVYTYTNAVDAATAAAEKHRKSVQKTETDFRNIEASARRMGEDIKESGRAFDEMFDDDGKLVDQAAIDKAEIDSLFAYYQEQRERLLNSQTNQPITIIDEEENKQVLANVEDAYFGMVTDLKENPVPVILEIAQDALNSVKKVIKDLMETVITIPVKLSKPSSNIESIGAYSGGQVGRMFGGGRIGGLFGHSSSRDTELIKARKGEWFVKNESGDYWGQDIMKGIVDPFSKMGRAISGVLSNTASMDRNNVTASRGNLQSSSGDDIFNAMQSFGTVNLNLPTAGPAIPVMMRQNDVAAFLSQMKTMGKLSS